MVMNTEQAPCMNTKLTCVPFSTVSQKGGLWAGFSGSLDWPLGLRWSLPSALRPQEAGGLVRLCLSQEQAARR